MIDYNTYGEKKLYTALNSVKINISKIESEQKQLDKKLRAEKEKAIKIHQAFINRLTPNEETAEALKNPSVYGTFNSHEEFEKSLEDEENESEN